MQQAMIKINLFGKVKIANEFESVDLSQKLGKLLLSIFIFIVYNRKMGASKEQLIATYWQENENPNNVLNYNIFRLRKVLNGLSILKNESLIVFSENKYILSDKFTYEIDTEQFDLYYQSLKVEQSKSKSLDCAMSFIENYQGDILDEKAQNLYFGVNEYYRKTFERVFEDVCETLTKEEQIGDLMVLAMRTTNILPDFELAHYYYLKAMIGSNEFTKAQVYYEYVMNTFNEVYGVPLSQKMRFMKDELMQVDEQLIPMDTVVEQLEQPHKEGAYFCDFVIFEYLYNLMLRNTKRDRVNYFLIILTLEEHDTEVLTIAMEKLKEAIRVSLRRCDIYMKLSQSQYSVLLKCEKDTNVMKPIVRVERNYLLSHSDSELKWEFRSLAENIIRNEAGSTH